MVFAAATYCQWAQVVSSRRPRSTATSPKQLPAFKPFQQDIPDRVQGGPTVTTLNRIGAFRLLDRTP